MTEAHNSRASDPRSGALSALSETPVGPDSAPSPGSAETSGLLRTPESSVPTGSDPEEGGLAPPPPGAAEVFGSRLPLAQRYAELLAGPGAVRGVIGPREAPRLWERHLMNCAVVAELMPDGASVADVGSGAGLPGIPMAIARPDLRLTLIEPLLRRTTWLTEVVDELGLGERVSIVRLRAEQAHHELGGTFDAATSRAVASLDDVARWSLPLLRHGGVMAAMKGDRAEEELVASSGSLEALGAQEWGIQTLGSGLLQTPTTVVWVRAGVHVTGRSRKPVRQGGARKAGRRAR